VRIGKTGEADGAGKQVMEQMKLQSLLITRGRDAWLLSIKDGSRWTFRFLFDEVAD